MRLPPVLPLLLALAAWAITLSGCEPRHDPTPGELADPDTVMEGRDTPIGMVDPTGEAAGRVAVARLQAVAGSGVTGQVHFEETARGVVVIAEVGGLPEGTHGLRVLEQTGCTDVDRPRPFNTAGAAEGARPAGSLDDIDVADDGTGRYERLHTALELTGPSSIIGRAVVALEAGHHHEARAEDQVVACGVIGPAVH